MNENEWLLLRLLDEVDVPIRGRTRLQKIVFILRSKFGRFRDYHYSFHYYGPFSHELADDLENLRIGGLIREAAVDAGDLTRYEIEISDRGRKKLEAAPRPARLRSSLVGEARRLNSKNLDSVISQAYGIARRESLNP